MASRRKRAPKSRARAIEIKAKLARKGVTAAELVAALREKYPEVIRVERDDFVELGLISLATSVNNLKSKKSKFQRDMFEGFAVPSTVSLRSHEAGRRTVTKNLDALTEAELQQCIDAHNRVPRQGRGTAEMTRLRDYVRPYWQPGWTLRKAFQAAQDAEAGDAAASSR